MTTDTGTRHHGRKHHFKKHVIHGKVWSKDQRIFTVGKSGLYGERVYVAFAEAGKYEVVKLSRRGLPRKTMPGKAGKPIRWVNNFAVRRPKGKWVDRVRYSVYLPLHKGKTFVYLAKDGLRYDKKPRPVTGKFLPRGKKWGKVTFEAGDPPEGWT